MGFHFDKSPVATGLALFALLCGAAWVRLNGIAWDGFSGYHPDERHMMFLSMAMFEALRDPAHSALTLGDWWLSEASPLNPHAGSSFLVYGEAPLLIAVAIGWFSGTTDWFAFLALARSIAAWVDVAAILAVFLGGRALAGNRAGLIVALLFAVMPTVLQLANFHTVDVWLGAAVAWALVPMLALATGSRARKGWGGGMAVAMTGAAAGAFGGLAVACKVTGVLLVPAGIVALLLGWRRGGLSGWQAMLAGGCALVFAMVVFRLANPFAFAGTGVWATGLSPHWLGDFRELAGFTASPDFPPNWQWIAGYGPLRLLRDVVMFGAGPVASGLFVWLLWHHPRRWGAVLVPLIALAAFLVLTAVSQVSALRYVAPGLGAMAMALAPAVAWLGTRAAFATVLMALWWGGGAIRLHDGQHPRIAAAHWLWTLPRGTRLTNESAWDEGLPGIVRLTPQDGFRWPEHDGWFVFHSLAIEQPDSAEKAAKLANTLAQTDFLILSSDRQSGVMPRLPERFAMTAAHYAALESGAACFTQVLEIDRGYPLPGLRLGDGWAQEPWRVYDHPRVRIFRRDACFDETAYAARLRRALTGAQSGQ
ncbi:hypothetical protein N4R57_18160 [Rhodobacteraceae bacterium D3-12]|nr:hypothetical protein N4R57_18160 [Rhodobacteraceae bacterium D3-12]